MTFLDTRPGTTSTWRYAIHSKTLTCKARVLVRDVGDGEFVRGSQPYIRNGQPDQQNVLEIRRDVKSIAVKRVFTSVTEVVDKVHVTCDML